MATQSFLIAAGCLLACHSFARAQELDLPQAMATGTPMTAELAAERAVHTAPAIERAEALVRASEAAHDRVRAQLLPRLDGTARYTHIDGFPDARIELPGLVGPKISIPRNQYALSARLSYPVSDVLLALLPQLDAAEAQVHASQAQLVARTARVRFSARESFYQLARARGALAVAQRAAEQARTVRETIDAGVHAGVRAPADGASAAARLASAEQLVVAAQASVDVADAALRTLLQDAEGATYGVSEALTTEGVALQAVDVLVGRARAQRAEVVALRSAIEAQRKQARAQRASGYPHLGVYVGGDYAQPNRYQIPPRAVWQGSWEVGASLSYAPNDTISARRKAREDAANIDASEADLKELDRSLVLEVRTARATLARTEQNLAATRSAQDAAELAYARRTAELHGGQVTLADLFASEGELNAARLTALDAILDDKLARARLRYALGE